MIGTQQDFSMMGDAQLKQALIFAQRSGNTPEFLGLMAEAKKREKMRQEAQGVQAGQQAYNPTTIADQVMSGIANLDSGEHEYAGGGIVSFSGGGTAASAAFGQFLRAQGVDPANFSRLPQTAQETLRQLYSNATLGPQAGAPAAPTAAAGAPASASGGYGSQPATLAQRIVAPAGAAVREMPKGPLGALLAGGYALSQGSANALSNATDEQLDALSNDIGGDTGIAAAIMREARNKKETGNTRKEAQDRPYINPQAYREYTAPAAAAPAPRREVVSTERVSGPGRAPSTVSSSTGIAQLAGGADPSILSFEERQRVIKAEAKGDDDAVDAIYKKAIERDTAKRAELEEKGKSSKGILGIDMSGDTRDDIKNALGAAGIALLRSKSKYLDLGEGLAAGLEKFGGSKEKREEKLSLLDKAEEQRNLAILAAKQGNKKAAAEHRNAYEMYVDRIQDNARQDRQLTQTAAYQDRMATVAERNERNTAAYRNAQLRRHDSVEAKDKQARKEYADLLNRTVAAVDKAMPGATATERQAEIMARMRSALTMNPWMSQYAGGLGFTSAPTGKTYDLTED